MGRAVAAETGARKEGKERAADGGGGGSDSVSAAHVGRADALDRRRDSGDVPPRAT